MTAVAIVVEPAVVFTHKRFTFLAGIRAKNVVYEHMAMEYDGATTSEVMVWKPEAGVKLGLRVAF
ncbi:MAG: hypothetical protein H0T89_25260 [Deltaproteobacteria bacterium]|nr:hypothetical protein [Deltaproteobacteria bacterium]MDQ3297653.1 hypothetical protein [Myxococcota bacterium]